MWQWVSSIEVRELNGILYTVLVLYYLGLNGMPIPDQLPPELVPPSSRDLDNSVDLVKDLLKHETRSRSPSSLDAPISRLKNRSFNSSSPSLDANRDATIYKHSDSEPPGGFYKPRSRHIDRDAVRSRDDDDSPTADLSDMKRRLANTAQMLERTAQAEASRTKEDEELDQEMDDLKYRVKRVQDDLDYNARPPRTSSKDEERRRLERELLSLMHERIPEVERKIKAREERKEREKREWARDRDRANDRHGRFDKGNYSGRNDNKDDYSRRNDSNDDYSRRNDSKDDYSRRNDNNKDDYSRRNDDRDRSYSRGGDDQDRPYSRGLYGRDDRDRDRDLYRREPSPHEGRDYDRPQSATGRSPPPVPTPAANSVRDTPPIPQHPTPSKLIKNMTPAERQAFIKAEGQRLTQARMAALGVTTSAPSPVLDTSVEDRLRQEKAEAEEKVRAAEQQAKERERARQERLDHARTLKEGRTTPAPIPAASAPPPPPAPAPKATPRAAPAPPKARAPAPPPPRKAAPPVVASPPTLKPPIPVVPDDEIDHEALLRAREAELRKKREEKEAQFQAKLRLLEAEAEEAARQEEERYQTRLQALKARTAKAPTPPVEQSPPLASKAPPAPAIQPPPAAPPAPVPANSPIPSLPDKSTNPFSRLIKEGSSTSIPSVANGSLNPWSRPQTAPPPDLAPPKSPAPNAAKTSYNTAPSSIDDDWDEIKENDDSDASSDDEISRSRSARANIAQQLFGNILPRSASAAPSAPSAPAPPPPPPAAPSATPIAPPPPPAAPSATPIAPVAAPSSNDVGALMQSIQRGMNLRPTKTVDKSAPQVSGRVLGDVAPPPHISASAQPAPAIQAHVSQVTPMVIDNSSDSGHRGPAGWQAEDAVDVGAAPVELSPTMEDDTYQPPATHIPDILVDKPATEPISDIMADIDKSIRKRLFRD